MNWDVALLASRGPGAHPGMPAGPRWACWGLPLVGADLCCMIERIYPLTGPWKCWRAGIVGRGPRGDVRAGGMARRHPANGYQPLTTYLFYGLQSCLHTSASASNLHQDSYLVNLLWLCPVEKAPL